MPAFRRQQVQHACQSLLVALGYDEPDSSEDELGDEKEEKEGEIQSSSQEPDVVSDAAALDSSAEAAKAGAAAAIGASGGSASASVVAGGGGGRGKGWRASTSSSSASYAAFGRLQGFAPGGAAEVMAGEVAYPPAAVPAAA